MLGILLFILLILLSLYGFYDGVLYVIKDPLNILFAITCFGGFTVFYYYFKLYKGIGLVKGSISEKIQNQKLFSKIIGVSLIILSMGNFISGINSLSLRGRELFIAGILALLGITFIK